MKIICICVYKIDFFYIDGVYGWGVGNVIIVVKVFVVVMDMDVGVQGCGEFMFCGENYMVVYFEGVEVLVWFVVLVFFGEDFCQVVCIEQIMDYMVQGYGYVKVLFDVVCWDIVGKVLNIFVWMFLGGKLIDGVFMYCVVLYNSIEEMIVEFDCYWVVGYWQF